MKLQEIKLGIWLKYPNSNHFKVAISDFNNKTFWEDIEDVITPVEISEKTLLQLGFHKIYESDYHKKFELTNDLAFQVVQKLNGHYTVRHYGETLRIVEYIHQIQNLYSSIMDKDIDCA